MAVDGQALRQAMRSWATGVTVVTSARPGVRHGITVNSFTSLSLSPPLCLVCIDRRTKAHEEIPASGRFTVNVLSDAQEDVAGRFAGRRPDLADPFEGLPLGSAPSGAPVFTGALAVLDCRLTARFEGGDHTIFVGEVEHAEAASEEGAVPLLFYGGAFRRLGP